MRSRETQAMTDCEHCLSVSRIVQTTRDVVQASRTTAAATYAFHGVGTGGALRRGSSPLALQQRLHKRPVRLIQTTPAEGALGSSH